VKDKTLDGQLISLGNISDHCGHVLTGEETPGEMLEKISHVPRSKDSLIKRRLGVLILLKRSPMYLGRKIRW
jgi:hypothetical protein